MKGVNISSLDEPWKTIVLWLMKFFTCEGQYNTMLGNVTYGSLEV